MDTSKTDHQTFLLVGGTGLIGQLTLRRLLAKNIDSTVIAISRRALPEQHRRLISLTADLSDPAADIELAQRLTEVSSARIDVFLCALGTTQRDAGSTSAFRTVDFELAVRLARTARNLGARHAVVVSSVGADARSRNVYLKTKGEMEEGVGDLGFDGFDFLRPSLLLGKRKGRYRLGEHLAQMLSPFYNPMLGGPLRRYRAISADTIAAAMVALAAHPASGRHVHEYDTIRDLAIRHG
jgi:uncharacterized protein YbjT (DUF2867 family)